MKVKRGNRQLVLELTNLAQKEPPLAASQAVNEQRTNIRTIRPRRIMVVDDHRDAADLMAEMLRLIGHEVHTAYDGLEAMQVADAYRPEVMVLDIALPKLNGYEVARHIRKLPFGNQVALIALSGWGDDDDKRRALEAGFDYHVTKPVEVAAIQKLLDNMTANSVRY